MRADESTPGSTAEYPFTVSETTLAAPRAINLSRKVTLNATSSYREAQVRGRTVARSLLETADVPAKCDDSSGAAQMLPVLFGLSIVLARSFRLIDPTWKPVDIASIF
jgi:hypothetical protein